MDYKRGQGTEIEALCSGKSSSYRRKRFRTYWSSGREAFRSVHLYHTSFCPLWLFWCVVHVGIVRWFRLWMIRRSSCDFLMMKSCIVQPNPGREKGLLIGRGIWPEGGKEWGKWIGRQTSIASLLTSSHSLLLFSLQWWCFFSLRQSDQKQFLSAQWKNWIRLFSKGNSDNLEEDLKQVLGSNANIRNMRR